MAENTVADHERRIRALEAVSVDMVPAIALDIFAADPHRFSTRRCATCANISTIIGKGWGCEVYGKVKRPPGQVGL